MGYLGLRVWGLGCRVFGAQGLGFGVVGDFGGLRFRDFRVFGVQGSGFRVFAVLGFRVPGVGVGF